MKVVPARGLVERCCDLVFYKNFSDKTTYLSYKPCHQISCLPMIISSTMSGVSLVNSCCFALTVVRKILS